jgi:hypothetical protein
MRGRVIKAGIAVVLGAGSVLVTAGAAAAATVAVPCTGPGGGGTGLAAAITAANAGAGPSHIVLAQGCTYTLTKVLDEPDGGGLPAVVTPVVIEAPQVAPPTTVTRASGAPPFSIFNINDGGTLTLRNVTVSGGLAPDRYVGGGLGVAKGGTLHLVSSRVTGNWVRSIGGFIAQGGGIYSNGTVTLDASRVDHNTAVNAADGNLAAGGGIVSEGFDEASPATLVLRNSSVDHNHVSVLNGVEPGAVGAGIASLGFARTTLKDTDVIGNRADGGGTAPAALGGGLFDNLSFFTGEGSTLTTISGGHITGNTVHAEGGGFAAGAAIYDATNDTTTIDGVTVIEDNTATAVGDGAQALGGALFEEPSTALTISGGATIRGNHAGTVGAGSLAAGAGLANTGGATLRSVTVTGNVASGSGSEARALGGGVWSSTGSGPGDALALDGTTITGNTAIGRDGGSADGGGVYQDAGPITVSRRTTIAQNRPDNCAPVSAVPSCT